MDERIFWNRISAQQKGDREFLEDHGLEKPLRRRLPGETRTGFDWKEIDRQIDYLLEHHKSAGLPRGVTTRRASSLLAYFLTGKRPPTAKLVLLIGQLLEVEKIPIKYAKKREEMLAAAEYLQDHPKASNGEVAREVGVDKATVGRWRKDYPDRFPD